MNNTDKNNYNLIFYRNNIQNKFINNNNNNNKHHSNKNHNSHNKYNSYNRYNNNNNVSNRQLKRIYKGRVELYKMRLDLH